MSEVLGAIKKDVHLIVSTKEWKNLHEFLRWFRNLNLEKNIP